MQNAPREHSAILSTFIKLPFDYKTFVLSIFEWPLRTGFTVMFFLIVEDCLEECFLYVKCILLTSWDLNAIFFLAYFSFIYSKFNDF